MKRLPWYLLAAHALLLGWGALRHSPTWDEVPHLVAGISHWELGRFDLYRVNPPLVRTVAALPVILAGAEPDWRGYGDAPGTRSAPGVGRLFADANGDRVFWWLTLARWALIPFSLLGALVCYRWAGELYGEAAGLAAMVLWCFSPNILAHGQMITPDAGAAAVGITSAYMFWQWLKRPDWAAVVLAGILLGFTLLTKSTWILLFVIWPALWLVWRLLPAGADRYQRPPALQLAAILTLGVLVLNTGYGFEGSFTRLGEYQFVSRSLNGHEATEQHAPRTLDNRFRDTALADIPVPLPANFVMGIDIQKSDFERKKWSYLAGQWRLGGWWYFYLYALLLKVPLGTWLLFTLAVLASLLLPAYRIRWRDELALLFPLAVILAFVSAQTGFSHHLRYVLLIFPLAFIWISKVFFMGAAPDGNGLIRRVAFVALLWSLASSLWVYPHSLAYFNELAGGPRHGVEYLGAPAVDSNLDWGQDWLYLKRWVDGHPEARPMRIEVTGPLDPGVLGFAHDRTRGVPTPGWYALSVANVYDVHRAWRDFQQLRPAAMAGYSIRIYHITAENTKGDPPSPTSAAAMSNKKT